MSLCFCSSVYMCLSLYISHSPPKPFWNIRACLKATLRDCQSSPSPPLPLPPPLPLLPLLLCLHFLSSFSSSLPLPLLLCLNFPSLFLLLLHFIYVLSSSSYLPPFPASTPSFSSSHKSQCWDLSSSCYIRPM